MVIKWQDIDKSHVDGMVDVKNVEFHFLLKSTSRKSHHTYETENDVFSAQLKNQEEKERRRILAWTRKWNHKQIGKNTM